MATTTGGKFITENGADKYNITNNNSNWQKVENELTTLAQNIENDINEIEQNVSVAHEKITATTGGFENINTIYANMKDNSKLTVYGYAAGTNLGHPLTRNYAYWVANITKVNDSYGQCVFTTSLTTFIGGWQQTDKQFSWREVPRDVSLTQSSLTLENGFTNWGGSWEPPRAYRSGNLVKIQGMIRAGNNRGSGTIITNLASEFRHKHSQTFAVSAGPGSTTNISVMSNGEVKLEGGLPTAFNNYISLNPISYFVED